MRKFYILTMIFALLGISQVWANSAKITEWAGIRTWSGPHATFTLSGDKGKNSTLSAVDVDANQNVTINWTVDPGCTINVTELRLWIGHNGWFVSNCDVYINNKKAGTVGTIINEERDYAGYSLGNNDSFVFYVTKDINLYAVEIVYTITPNKPGASSTTQTINVTLDPAKLSEKAPQTVDFGIADAFAESIEFAVTPNSGFGLEKGLFYATIAGTYTAKARIVAKENCHEATDWSDVVTIKVNRRDPVLTLNANEAEVQVNKTVDLSELIAEHVGDALEYAVTSANKDKATLNGAVFTATETGEYTVQIKSKQGDQYNETTKDVTVTVTKVVPDFVQNFTQEEADALLVEGKIENAFTLTNVSADANLSVKITTLTISDVKKGDEVLAYDKATNTITALNAGTASIQFVQAETEQIKAGSSEVFAFTVSKHENTLYVKGVADFAATIQPDAVIENVVFSANNNDYTNCPIEWAVAEGAEFAVFDPETKTITANYKLGTATWTLTQPENYKYQAGEDVFSVTVASAAEATDCYVLNDDDEYGMYFLSKDSREFSWEGYGDKISFYAKRASIDGAAGIAIYLKLGDNTDYEKEEWKWISDETGLHSSYDHLFEFEFDQPNVTGVRFAGKGAATGSKYVKDIKVTRKTYLNAEDVEIAVFPNEAGEGKLTVDYSLANGGDLKIVCDNDLFTLGQNSIADVDCSSGKVEIPVSFAAQEEQGVYEANVTIYNAVYSKNVKLSATVRKLDPVITWDDIELVYGDEAALNATIDVTELELQYALVGETDVIRIADGKIFADKAGAAQIKAFVEETDKYNAAQKIIDVTVKKATQTIEWTQELTTLEVGQYLQLEATASSGLEVTFISSDETIAYVDEFNMLHALLEGDVTIKAVQAGNDNVEGTETEEKALTIIPSTDQREEQVIIWENQILEVDMAEGAETVILTAYLESGIDVTYESSDETIAKIGKEQNELELWIDVIVPIRVGKVRITASREGDDTFKPAVPVTKEFEIINSDDPETGLDNIESAKRATKILLNGQIFILRDGKIYDLRGQVVR